MITFDGTASPRFPYRPGSNGNFAFEAHSERVTLAVRNGGVELSPNRGVDADVEFFVDVPTLSAFLALPVEGKYAATEVGLPGSCQRWPVPPFDDWAPIGCQHTYQRIPGASVTAQYRLFEGPYGHLCVQTEFVDGIPVSHGLPTSASPDVLVFRRYDDHLRWFASEPDFDQLIGRSHIRGTARRARALAGIVQLQAKANASRFPRRTTIADNATVLSEIMASANMLRVLR